MNLDRNALIAVWVIVGALVVMCYFVASAVTIVAGKGPL